MNEVETAKTASDMDSSIKKTKAKIKEELKDVGKRFNSTSIV